MKRSLGLLNSSSNLQLDVNKDRALATVANCDDKFKRYQKADERSPENASIADELNSVQTHLSHAACGKHKPLSCIPKGPAIDRLSCLVEYATFDDFAKEIRRIISVGDERKIPLRIMGGAAIRMHCPENEVLYERLKRTPKHDMDFVTYAKFRPLTKQLFMDLGYEPYVSLMLTGATGRHRQIFNDKEGNKAVDVFLGKLEMCHVIDFEGRLEVDSPTIPLAELLLQKLQVVQTNEKDILDALILLREHEVGKTDREEVNADYVASVLAGEWGFYYTVTRNLQKVKDFLSEYDALSKEDKSVISERIDKIRERVEATPKNLSWKMRARVGPAVRWYNVVEEVQRDSAS